MDKFAGVMKKIFPIFDQAKNGDNLTEIPTPHKTLHQRFLTISESEPFGPVDAAKIFDLEPAQQTLDRLTELKQETGASVAVKEVVVGQEREGDKNQFRFKMASSGNVGFRYGASRRDKKKNRAVGFDKLGRMVYAV